MINVTLEKVLQLVLLPLPSVAKVDCRNQDLALDLVVLSELSEIGVIEQITCLTLAGANGGSAARDESRMSLSRVL